VKAYSIQTIRIHPRQLRQAGGAVRHDPPRYLKRHSFMPDSCDVPA
jgi:hypothetical protein